MVLSCVEIFESQTSRTINRESDSSWRGILELLGILLRKIRDLLCRVVFGSEALLVRTGDQPDLHSILGRHDDIVYLQPTSPTFHRHLTTQSHKRLELCAFVSQSAIVVDTLVSRLVIDSLTPLMRPESFLLLAHAYTHTCMHAYTHTHIHGMVTCPGGLKPFKFMLVDGRGWAKLPGGLVTVSIHMTGASSSRWTGGGGNRWFSACAVHIQ